MKITQCILAILLASSFTLVSSFVTAPKAVAQDNSASERKTRRTPALRTRVYDQLARAQKVADEGNTEEALEILDVVKSKESSMNSYELAMLHNFYGFIYYNAEDYDKAIASFETVVEQQPIPESFEQSTLFSLAQLQMMRGNYDKTIEYLERWEALQPGKLPVKNLVLKAQAMYQKKDYQAASEYINEAILQQENSEEGYKVDENWYVLQRAIYYELKQPEKVTKVLEKMVKLFDRPEYWVQLAGMYGELGFEKKQLAILEAAYQSDYINKASDVFNLAQLYYYHQVPYKGARLMEQAMENGVLEKNLRNLKFLAQTWTLAKENEKAVPVMRSAAALSEDGELDAQLAQILLNMDRFEEAIESAQKALEKGGLRNQGTTHLVLGMSYFNQKRYVDALNQLAEAEKHPTSRGMAQQWRKFVQSEKSSTEQLQAELSAS
ncbi:tetratricopeptide repeat protein [Aliiglaciecola sp. 3_MG-2023]|uniref:tetratricopeptide repeat protein n=1 Tax=Aliiglaciecola sp. 3_MG-2023 TaxID=3062644 RepID=UPI0026E17135|nr:tetratricopeptide repeat protein [Aliiglaciecola sp. 3_MG-2023]MDO6695072.1 tetratricopeptide repeat protein [Aliiglaciecola sp. 3_MG-2023]